MQLIHLIAHFFINLTRLVFLRLIISVHENDSIVTKAHNQALKIGKWGWWFNGGNVKWERESSTPFQQHFSSRWCKKFNSCVNEYFRNQNFYSFLVRTSASFLSPFINLSSSFEFPLCVCTINLKVSAVFCNFNVRGEFKLHNLQTYRILFLRFTNQMMTWREG